MKGNSGNTKMLIENNDMYKRLVDLIEKIVGKTLYTQYLVNKSTNCLEAQHVYDSANTMSTTTHHYGK